MDAPQSPNMTASADLLRQSSTVSGDARQESGVLTLLQAAANRADKWRATMENGFKGMPYHKCLMMHARLWLVTVQKFTAS